jgi:hypothetical protein
LIPTKPASKLKYLIATRLPRDLKKLRTEKRDKLGKRHATDTVSVNEPDLSSSARMHRISSSVSSRSGYDVMRCPGRSETCIFVALNCVGRLSNTGLSDPLSVVAGFMISFRLRHFMPSDKLLFTASEALKMPSWKNSRELVEIILAFALFPVVLALLGTLQLVKLLGAFCRGTFRRH